MNKEELSQTEKDAIDAVDQKALDRRIDLQMRVMQGEELTRAELIELNGWEDHIPTFPVTKKTYNLRAVMGQLTKAEMRAKQKHDNKMTKINDGMDRIYALVNHGISLCR